MNNSYNNNQINNKDNEYNIKLYNSVFNNIYLKRIIFNHLNKYNILYNKIVFQTLEEFKQFKYKDYLNSIEFKFDYDLIDQLPENIKSVQLTCGSKTREDNIIPVVPNHIESISVSTFLYKWVTNISFESFISKLSKESLSKLNGLKINNHRELSPKSIPQSISKLNISVSQLLEKNLFSNNLKELNINVIESFEDGCFPESLINASFYCQNPLVINQLSFNGLVNLCFGCNNDIGSNIMFPNTLQHLTLYCNTFNSRLPDSLKSLKLELEVYKYEVVFPLSLEYLKVEIKSEDIPIQNKFLVESSSLKRFELQLECSSIVDNNGISVLPDKLTKLKFRSFNKVLQIKQLPSTLTSLDLGMLFNQVIDVNVLPPYLKKLKLGRNYTHIINPLSIPQQLELLLIDEDQYQYEHPINLTKTTHPNIVISCQNMKSYYNSLDTSILKLRLPGFFKSSLSTLQLHDKSSLEYLHLGVNFNQPIQLSDLPIINNIKTLVLSYQYRETINLECFQNLETIILKRYYGKGDANLISTTINQQDGSYNYYSLKNIIIYASKQFGTGQLFNSIDINFYQFIKIVQK